MATYTLPPAQQLKREAEAIRDDFSDFHDFRDVENGKWFRILNRQLSPNILPELRRYQDGLEYQGADLEEALRQYKSLLRSNPTIFDVNVHSSSHSARDTETALKLSLANWWNDMNRNRWIDDYDAEYLAKCGISVKRLCLKPLPKDWESRDKVEVGRPTEYKKVLLDGFGYIGDYLDPDAAWYTYTLPVIDCDVKNKKGERPYFEGDRLAWTGEALPPDAYQNNANKKIKIIVRDAKDLVGALCPLDGCDHVRRMITVYCCGDGKDDYEEVETTPSPFATCSFHITGAALQMSERNPHLIFRPLMAPLYQIQAWINTLVTELAVQHRREAADTSLYANQTQSNPQMAANQTVMAEGGPKDTISMPDAAPGEIPAINATIQRVPGPVTTNLMALLNIALEKQAQYMPNSILTGSSQTLTANSTASNYVSSYQAAGVLLRPPTENMDAMTERWARETLHAIAYQTYFLPDDMEVHYMAQVTGAEHVMSYGTRVDRGTRVYVDKKRASAEIDLAITTNTETWAEKREKRMTAITGMQAGLYTLDDGLKDWGFFDVQLQKELLGVERIDRALAPAIDRMVLMKLAREATAQSGYDFGSIIQDAMPLPEGAGGAPPDSGGLQRHDTSAANVAKMTAPPATGPTVNPVGSMQQGGNQPAPMG